MRKYFALSSTSMKTSDLIKTILLALPFITLVYVFIISDLLESGNGIGGGSYDLTKPYTVVVVALYLFILNLGLLIQDAASNKYFLLAGIILLITTIILAVRTIN